MKTSNLKKFAWVFFALALSASTAFAQGGRQGNRNVNQQKATCLNYISGLTEDQQVQIKAMDEKHLEMMDGLRTKRRSTTNAVEKSEIRTEMLKTVEAHRNAVRELLTEDQQKRFDQLQANAGTGKNQNVGRGNGNRGKRGRGQGNFCGNAGANRGWNQAGRGACRFNN
ncbi:MAG: Spy/CpxP family protein refolding chaperone [Draconibacterium sp.]